MATENTLDSQSVPIRPRSTELVPPTVDPGHVDNRDVGGGVLQRVAGSRRPSFLERPYLDRDWHKSEMSIRSCDPQQIEGQDRRSRNSPRMQLGVYLLTPGIQNANSSLILFQGNTPEQRRWKWGCPAFLQGQEFERGACP